MNKLKDIEKSVIKMCLLLEKGQSKKEPAELLVEARVNFFVTPTGIPDYQGRSMSYRSWYGNILDTIGLEGGEREQFTSAMRYAVGNALRYMLTDDELDEAGLIKTSPKERGKRSYDKVAKPYHLLRTFNAGSPEDILEFETLVESFTQEILPTDIRNTVIDSLTNKLLDLKDTHINPTPKPTVVTKQKVPRKTFERPSYVYHIYDSTGDLLYVGKTFSIGNRFFGSNGHSHTKEWWASVSKVVVEDYETDMDAFTAEAYDIKRLKPLHNLARPTTVSKIRPPRKSRSVYSTSNLKNTFGVS